MGYLARNMEKRKDPSLLVPGARSIICFLAPYSSIKSSVAAFALGEDYHDVIKDKLHRISLHLSQECAKHGLEYQGRCFTDSAPVMERHWAAEAGLGFIGKNNFLISPKYGLRTLIGVIICNIPPEWLGERKEKIAEGCGECRRCIDACPEGALYAPFRLDARNVSPTTPLSRMSSIPPALWSTKADLRLRDMSPRLPLRPRVRRMERIAYQC